LFKLATTKKKRKKQENLYFKYWQRGFQCWCAHERKDRVFFFFIVYY